MEPERKAPAFSASVSNSDAGVSGAGASLSTFTRISWTCTQCQRSCLPVRSESRCLCGHRLKEHDTPDAAAGRCRSARCACKRFTYIVAEGAWILRCSCKHKHTDHDPNTWACCKSSCRCTCFHSPWTCNCNHSWSEHQQVVEVKETSGRLDPAFLAEIGDGLAEEVNRWDLIHRH